MKWNWRKTLVYAAVTLFCVILQAFWNRFSGLWGVQPDGVVAVLVPLGMLAGGLPAALCGAAAGLLIDVQTGPFFGFHIAVYALSAVLGARLPAQEAKAVSALPAAALCVAVKWLLWTLAAYLSGYAPDFYAGLVKTLVPSAAFTALLTFVSAALLIRIFSLKFMADGGRAIRYL